MDRMAHLELKEPKAAKDLLEGLVLKESRA